MTPLEFLGTLSMGATLVLLLAFGWAAWFFRGHRGDLSGLAVRREWWHRTETPPEPYVTKAGWAMPERLPPAYVGKIDLGDGPTEAQRAVSDMMRASMQHGQATVRERGEDE